MARTEITDTAIASALVSMVQQIYNCPDRDKLTVNYARQEVEDSLGLEVGYLKEGDWKAKSKEIIVNTLVSRNPTATKLRTIAYRNLVRRTLRTPITNLRKHHRALRNQ